MIAAAVLALSISGTSYAVFANPSEKNEPVANTEINNEKSLAEERLAMLERAIVPASPDETIALWAKAVAERNGAVQYALFNDDVRVGVKGTLESFHWVTGVSSPWVESYKVIGKKENKDKTMEYVVEFDLATSTGYAGKDHAAIGLVEKDGKWFISGVGPAEDGTFGVWNTPESVNEVAIEKNLKDVKTFESKNGFKVQFLKKDMDKLAIKDSTCKNEEGNPLCTNFYYKDLKNKKEILVGTVIRLTEKQVKSSYYKDHPFLNKVGENNKLSFYTIYPSEHPYGKNENSAQGKEWSYLMNLMKKRTAHILYAN